MRIHQAVGSGVAEGLRARKPDMAKVQREKRTEAKLNA
jgi:hypothetical protein